VAIGPLAAVAWDKAGPGVSSPNLREPARRLSDLSGCSGTTISRAFADCFLVPKLCVFLIAGFATALVVFFMARAANSHWYQMQQHFARDF